MLSPTASEEEEESHHGLSLDADVDSVARMLRKRGIELDEEEKAELRTKVEKWHHLTRKEMARTAEFQYNVSRGENMPIPWEMELKVALTLLPETTVASALWSSSVYTVVRMILSENDALWRHWWRRDFPELVHELGPELPEWIVRGTHGQEDLRYARVPWRRYYAWSEFFRRSALRELARLYRQAGEAWIEREQARPQGQPRPRYPLYRNGQFAGTRDIDPMPLQVERVSGEGAPPVYEVANLVIPPFEQCGLDRAYGLALVDGPRYYFLRHLAGRGQEEPRVHNHAEAQLFAADENVTHRSSIYALIEMLFHNGTEGRGTGMEWWLGQDYALVPYDNALYLGGKHWVTRTENARLNFDYFPALRAYAHFYCRTSHVPNLPDFEEDDFDPTDTQAYPLITAEVSDRILRTLPPAPMIDGVWYIRSHMSSTPIASPCVGCGSQIAPTIRCKACGKTYCTHDCQKVNWKLTCSPCGKK